VNERQISGFDLLFERRFVHEGSDTEVGQEQSPEILTGQIRSATAKHDSCATKTRLEFG
jgi:hypothetical protein